MKYKKVYNLIPGERVDNIEIVETIKCKIANVELNDCIMENEQSYISYISGFHDCYVLYLDPMNIIIRLYKVDSNKLLSFLSSNISFYYGRGLDIAVCSLDIDCVIVFNHDGQAFLIK